MTHPVSGPVDGNFTNKRRQWLRQAGMAVGAAVMAPGIARAATGPAEPPSTVTQPPRDFGPDGAPTTYFTDPDVLTAPSVQQLAFRREPTWQIREYVCEENTRLTSGTEGGSNIDLGLDDDEDPFAGTED